MLGDHADGHVAHLSGLAGLHVADATALIARRGHATLPVAILARTTHLAQINLDLGSQRLDRTPTDIHADRRLRARPRPRQHSQSVLGMFIEPCRSVATKSSRRIVT
jgi:hypothetical protein